jgi:hypothetical protein
VNVANREAVNQRKLLPTLAINALLGFETADEKKRFSKALGEAVMHAATHHSAAAVGAANRTNEKHRPCRLVVGCYPIPPAEKEEKTHAK